MCTHEVTIQVKIKVSITVSEIFNIMCSLWRVCNPLLLSLSFLLTQHPTSVSKTAVIVLEGGKRGMRGEEEGVPAC